MRVFLGLPLPEAEVKALTAVGRTLRNRFPGLVVTREEGLHVTLLFLGTLEDGLVERLKSLLDSPALPDGAIRTGFQGLGTFPARGNPRVIYAGIKRGSVEITAFYQALDGLLSEANFPYQRESRPFHPHVTVARNKFEKIDPAVIAETELSREEFWLDRCVLFQSVLDRQGARYLPLAARDLKRDS